jgi:hypothetical protein
MGRTAKDDMVYYKLLTGKHHKRNPDAKTQRNRVKVFKAGETVPFGPDERHPKVDDVRWALADGQAAPDAPGADEFTGKYEISSRGGGWFDVVDVKTGEALNTSGLREEDAKNLLEGYAAADEADADDGDGDEE